MLGPKRRAGRYTIRDAVTGFLRVHNPGMDQTKTNVPERVCSKCRRLYAVQEFPYPHVVWWCRPCWRQFRIKQNEKRRRQRHAALEQYFSRPRPGGWRTEHFMSKGTMDVLSPSEGYMVQVELSRLYEQCRKEGRPLTQQKIASLKANAIFIVRYVRSGRARSWIGNYWKRRKLWERIQQERHLAQFKARPIEERDRFLSLA